MEQQLAVIEHRLSEIEDRHETVPTRVTKLEQQFEHMAGQLSELNQGQQKLTVAVNVIGSKVGRLLTILTLVGAVLQMAVPALLRVWFP
jgi:DNA anti-recombination protein RmuC